MSNITHYVTIDINKIDIDEFGSVLQLDSFKLDNLLESCFDTNDVETPYVICVIPHQLIFTALLVLESTFCVIDQASIVGIERLQKLVFRLFEKNDVHLVEVKTYVNETPELSTPFIQIDINGDCRVIHPAVEAAEDEEVKVVNTATSPTPILSAEEALEAVKTRLASRVVNTPPDFNPEDETTPLESLHSHWLDNSQAIAKLKAQLGTLQRENNIIVENMRKRGFQPIYEVK